MAADEPAQYLRLIAQILPRELDIALNVNSDLFAEARDFVEAYRMARSYIGATDQPLVDDSAVDEDPIGAEDTNC